MLLVVDYGEIFVGMIVCGLKGGSSVGLVAGKGICI